MIDGVMGGRSTYGICLGALPGGLRRATRTGSSSGGLGVVLATRYSDDEEGSPWSFVLYVDERGDEAQREVLERSSPVAGQDAARALPLGLEGEPPACGSARGDRDRARARRAAGSAPAAFVEVRAAAGRERRDGHLRHPRPRAAGRELVAESLEVHDGELEFSFRGSCAFESDFAYEG